MKELKIRLTGTSPLMMHNNRGANPLSPWAKIMKPLTAKRNKTDSDYEEIARMEWEVGLYLDDGVVVVPSRCIEKCLWIGAKKSKNGPKVLTGVVIDENSCKLEYSGKQIKADDSGEFPNSMLDAHYDAYKDQRMVKVGTAQVLRTRPIFNDWAVNVTLVYDENTIDKRTLLSCAKDAGRLVGLLEMRPQLGKFTVEVVK